MLLYNLQMSQQYYTAPLVGLLKSVTTTHFYCDNFLMASLNFCHNNKELCRDICTFPDLAIFVSFLAIFTSFFIKTLQNTNLSEDSIIMD